AAGALLTRTTRTTKSQSSRLNVLDVDADAVPAQRARRVDRGDGQLDQAPNRQDGDGEPRVSARGRNKLRDAATIVHRRPQRGKGDDLGSACVGDVGLTCNNGARGDQG